MLRASTWFLRGRASVNKQILIRGGTVLTGARSGRPKRLDILVEDDRIVRLGKDLRDPKARVLDAEGALVSPGFIDVHAHSDITAFLDPLAQCRVHEGVTTELSGMCGFSLFPLTGATADERRKALRKEGFDADWSTAAEFFSCLEEVGTAVNRGFFTGHGTLRTSAMGYSSRPARRRDLRRMERLLAESLEQGAFGLSSGLIYSPGCFATRGEMAVLCKVAARYGRPYVTHMRSEGRALMQSLRETISHGRASGVALHISHIKVAGRENWWKFDKMKRALRAAHSDGLDLTGDRYPYTASQTNLSTLFPDRLMEGGKEKALARLKDRRTRKRLMAALLKGCRRKDSWDTVVIARAEGRAQECEGMTVRQAAERMGMDPPEAVFEILICSKMSASAIFFTMSDEYLEEILTWPFICIGSDSAARAVRGATAQGKPHPRTFGSFGRFLSEYVLRRKLLTMPEAIAKITRFPAERFGLKDRGVLRRGAYADIVVFDPAQFRDRATYEDPFQLSTGMRHVLVNGTLVLKDGKQTRTRPGRVLRIED